MSVWNAEWNMQCEGAAQEVILASGSPQRKAILEELGILYTAVAMDVEEVVLESPLETVIENARRKMAAAMRIARNGQAVIAADTVVWTNGRILGKPGTSEKAVEYLKLLSGNKIRAYSGLAVGLGGQDFGWCCGEYATIHIRELSPAEIGWYVSTGEPLSRAGAIGISHYGEAFVTGVEGAYSCVAGLPKDALLAILGQSRELASAVLPVPQPPEMPCDRRAVKI